MLNTELRSVNSSYSGGKCFVLGVENVLVDYELLANIGVEVAGAAVVARQGKDEDAMSTFEGVC